MVITLLAKKGGVGKSRTDWRYDNIEYLQGATFRLAKYKAPSADWDHDHCSGCWAKFADFDGTDILHEGYFAACPDKETSEPEFVSRCTDQGMACIQQPTVNGAFVRLGVPRVL